MYDVAFMMHFVPDPDQRTCSNTYDIAND